MNINRVHSPCSISPSMANFYPSHMDHNHLRVAPVLRIGLEALIPCSPPWCLQVQCPIGSSLQRSKELHPHPQPTDVCVCGNETSVAAASEQQHRVDNKHSISSTPFRVMCMCDTYLILYLPPDLPLDLPLPRSPPNLPSHRVTSQARISRTPVNRRGG